MGVLHEGEHNMNGIEMYHVELMNESRDTCVAHTKLSEGSV